MKFPCFSLTFGLCIGSIYAVKKGIGEKILKSSLLGTGKRENGIELAVDSNQGNQSSVSGQQQQEPYNDTDAIIIAVIVALAAAALVGILVSVICWCKLKKSSKELNDFDYPAYGSTIDQTSTKSSTGDRKLAQSAQMYHFEHQKRQMLELEKSQNAVSKSGSDHSSDGESADDDDYTVYECPGLATTGDIEVPNPLFAEPPPPPPLHAGQPPAAPNGNGGHMPENLHHHMINGYKEP